MYQSIPANVSAILFKRVLVLLIIMMTLTAALYVKHIKNAVSDTTETTATPALDLKHTGIAFTYIDF